MTPPAEDAAHAAREARKARRRSRRREAILDAALAVLADVGAAGFTVAAVAARADVSKPSVHYYFATREVLVGALAARLIAAEVDALLPVVAAAPDGISALQAHVRAKVARFRADPEAFRVLYLEAGALGRVTPEALAEVYATASRLNDALEARLREDLDAGRLRREVDPRQLVNVAYMSVQGILVSAASMEAMGGSFRWSPEALAESLCDLLANGARPAEADADGER